MVVASSSYYFDDKSSRIRELVIGSAQTPLKRTTPSLRAFLVLSELIQRPLTRAASKGLRALTHATRLHLHSACAWSKSARKHLSSKNKSSQRTALNERVGDTQGYRRERQS